jgi:lipoprotein-anchoring transpeptidase ErfK/SrfK
MRRICVSALLASALYGAGSYVPAFAQASGPDIGGGLIQMLFSGAAREPAVQRPFQPAPQYPTNPPPGYRSVPPANSQSAPAPQARYQPAAAPEPDYSIIPMPQLGYEPLPPPPSPRQVARAELAYAPSSQSDMAHPLVDPKFDRQLVDYKSEEKPGTIVIDTPSHFLFLVQDRGKAMRYGIGVGRPGFTWEGTKTITAKKEWPDWYPPADMIKRRPDLPRYMAGGPENPLGARAMYLGSTVYRIHGSNEPWTIGSNVSSGCIRLRNADVIDLYNRVPVGAKVVVM